MSLGPLWSFRGELDGLLRLSGAMRETLHRHPDWAGWLRERVESGETGRDLDREWGAWMAAGEPGVDRLNQLRGFKRREYLDISFRDVSGLASLEETIARLSALAAWTIAVALDIVRSGASEALPAGTTTPAAEGFAVLALGKLGGWELNYSSDVDLIFCRRESDDEPEARFFTRMGEKLVQALGQPGPEGILYRVDMRLRPQGGTGPLVPTVASLENYYESWGEAWERQALIKARPICGDPELCRRFERFASRFTFARQMDDSSLEEIKRVKHRSEKEYAVPGDRIHVKQGPGGIRDIEFYVQYLQLFNGSRHPEVRPPATLDAIHALGSLKILLAGEESHLSLAYRFFRHVEHRLQLQSMTPQALIPENAAELGRLAHGLGFGADGEDAAQAFRRTLDVWRRRVRSILERIYLTPGTLRPGERQEEFAQLLSERTPRERVRELLSPYGFQDIDKAWQNIRLMALGPAGHLLPPGERRAFLEIVFPMLEVLRDSYDPDLALHHLESFAAASGNRVSFLRALASRRPHLARLCNLLALSNLCHQILTRHPEYFDSLARGIFLHEGRGCTEMLAELQGRMLQAPAGRRADALRRYRQREMVRIAYRDLAGLAGPLEISAELSRLAEACLRIALQEACREEKAGLPPLWIVALGKLGSRQMHYSSDLDLMFLYPDPPEGTAPEERTRLQRLEDGRVERLLEFMSGVSAEGIAYKVDLRLRPEGASGLLARSWSSFVEYAGRYMQPWERMALVRSRILAGEEEVRAQWARATEDAVYGFDWDDEALAAVRHLKRRIETETNREDRIHLDFKFGNGGISDLEFLVQLLQCLNGGKYADLRVPGVEAAVGALGRAGVLPETECTRLLEAHRFQRKVENHYQLIEEWTSREVSRAAPVLTRLSRSLGYSDRESGEARKAFLAEWETHAGEVRAIVERRFYPSKVGRG